MSKWGLKHKGAEILSPEEYNAIVDALEELSKISKKREIRHTIKASSDTWTDASYTSKPEWGLIMLNWDNFDGAIAYLEIASKVSGGTGYIRLYNLTDDMPVEGSEIVITSTDYTVQRSSTLTLPSGNKVYVLQAYITGGNTAYIVGASIVIIQS
jgi:hypothetical protein